ncbi:MAG: hypothetical protein A2V90_09810 [Gammaproteobacteria bacterium RBG_16_57_12]|nr:MAG: hypothetical protein A2V90_09810 [Gammaproteobacteria bacterium RBG_16_57_12]
MLALALTQTCALAADRVEITIIGIDGEIHENARASLSLNQQQHREGLTEARIRRLHEKAPEQIRLAMQPFGYYRPQIISSLKPVGAEQWQAEYKIDPGLPLLITRLDYALSGAAADDAEFLSGISSALLHEGAILDHRRYEQLKSVLVRQAAELGYFAARLTEHKITIDMQNYQSTVLLHFDSGPRYRFGRVNFNQDTLDPALLSRYTPFQPHDPYSLMQVIELQQALNDSDYFNAVEVTPDLKNLADIDVPIDVQLYPRKRNKYIFGIGYGTDTGARAKLGWEMPRVNRSGHRLETAYKISHIGDSITGTYRIPTGNPVTDQFILSISNSSEQTTTSDSSKNIIGASLAHGRGRWREVLSVNYQQEQFTVGNDEGQSSLLMPGINWTRVWGANRIEIRRGARLLIDVRGASDAVLSDTSFIQGRIYAKTILPIFEQSRLIVRGSAGTSYTPQFAELPASVRFFTGGSQTVRGYRYNALAPQDSAGQPIGGRHLLVGSVEYEQRLDTDWWAAIFHDTGNALDDFNGALNDGAGIGLRWRSPVGPIRFDLAWALSEPGTPWRFHIDIGPDL